MVVVVGTVVVVDTVVAKIDTVAGIAGGATEMATVVVAVPPAAVAIGVDQTTEGSQT